MAGLEAGDGFGGVCAEGGALGGGIWSETEQAAKCDGDATQQQGDMMIQRVPLYYTEG